MFQSPRRESNPQPSVIFGETIELPEFNWQREGYDVNWFVRATYVLLIQQYVYVYISY